MLLINEASPAQLALPFLTFLKDNRVTYKDSQGRDYPLLASLTSVGDIATKFAFPGGQWISPHRPPLKKIPRDEFGIDDENIYYLLTTANTVALQNWTFVQRQSEELESTPQGAFVTLDISPKNLFDFVSMTPASSNDTPYWVGQLPQIFAPDHGSVFGYQFMRLLNEFVSDTHHAGRSAPAPPMRFWRRDAASTARVCLRCPAREAGAAPKTHAGKAAYERVAVANVVALI
jgi:hypothetical protein